MFASVAHVREACWELCPCVFVCVAFATGKQREHQQEPRGVSPVLCYAPLKATKPREKDLSDQKPFNTASEHMNALSPAV